MKGLLQQHWEEYERRCVPEDALETQRRDMRDTFFSGAITMFGFMSADQPLDARLRAEKLQMAFELQDEINEFRDELMSRAGLNEEEPGRTH